jgi:cytochrome c oxidase subunit 4
MSNEQKEHVSHFKEYMTVFFFLSFFTVIEVWIPSLKNMSSVVKGVLLTFLACTKAWIVAFYYMHLKDEKLSLKIIACIPLVAAGYAYFLVLESLFR